MLDKGPLGGRRSRPPSGPALRPAAGHSPAAGRSTAMPEGRSRPWASI